MAKVDGVGGCEREPGDGGGEAAGPDGDAVVWACDGF